MSGDSNSPHAKACVEELISGVQQRPILFDLKHPDHKDQTKVGLAWRDILQSLMDTFTPDELMRSKLSTIKDVKKKYYGLRSSYRANKRKLTAPSGSGLDAIEKSLLGHGLTQ